MRNVEEITSRLRDLHIELASAKADHALVPNGRDIVLELQFWARVRELEGGIAELNWVLGCVESPAQQEITAGVIH